MNILLDNHPDKQLIFKLSTDTGWILARLITLICSLWKEQYPNLKLALSPPDGSVLFWLGYCFLFHFSVTVMQPCTSKNHRLNFFRRNRSGVISQPLSGWLAQFRWLCSRLLAPTGLPQYRTVRLLCSWHINIWMDYPSVSGKQKVVEGDQEYVLPKCQSLIFCSKQKLFT